MVGAAEGAAAAVAAVGAAAAGRSRTPIERAAAGRSAHGTIDRRLAAHKKRSSGRRLYGRTKPGTLLKHQHSAEDPDRWDVDRSRASRRDRPGGALGQLARTGSSLHSLNVTDIAHDVGGDPSRDGQRPMGCSAWRSRRSSTGPALSPLRGIDSDNGSEFINDHLLRFCRDHARSSSRAARPYKKDDNAHIEQKNWTHVQASLLGWHRYDTDEALAAINDLYRNELRLMQNLFQPSVKLLRKTRRGARSTRQYDPPRRPRWTDCSLCPARTPSSSPSSSSCAGASIPSRSQRPSIRQARSHPAPRRPPAT